MSNGLTNNLSIQILSINVGGLQRRLQGPDFEDFIQNYSLICIQETHFDGFDSINIEGFTALPLMIRKRARNRSGGIAILVKDNMLDKVKILKNSGENFYWFTLLNCFAVNILFCAVYIPPECSAYSEIGLFDTLESDLVQLNSDKNFEVCLLGDFNAHTCSDSDFITIDDTIEQNLHIDNIYDRVSIEDLGFSPYRYNSDNTQIDNYGKRLLEMCRSFNVYIANGRLGGDKFLGNKTCKASTVVDYALLSPLLFTLVNDFKVLPFDPMLSDAHCGIHISLASHPDRLVDLSVQDNDTQSISRAIWDKSKQDSFLQNLNNEEINHFICHMDSLEGDFTKETVELLTSQCTSLLYNAADAAGMIKHNVSIGLSNRGCRARKSTVRPWFNNECRKMQQQYRRAKNIRRRINDAENFAALNDASKAYKKCLKKKFFDYKKEFIKKLRGLKKL